MELPANKRVNEVMLDLFDAGIDTRTYNCLTRYWWYVDDKYHYPTYIPTVQEVRDTPDSALLRMRNFGQSSLALVRRIFNGIEVERDADPHYGFCPLCGCEMKGEDQAPRRVQLFDRTTGVLRGTGTMSVCKACTDEIMLARYGD